MSRQEYLDQLMLSMRLRDFPAARIRETLAEVEGHLEASGEDPRQTFGEPSEFVAGLDAARPRPICQRRVHAASLCIIGAGSLFTVWSAFKGISALLTDGETEVASGEVLAFAVTLAGAAVLWRLFAAYADGRRSIWPAVAAFTTLAASAGVIGALLTQPVLFSVPWWASLVVAATAAVATESLVLVRSEPLYPRSRSG